MTTLPGYKPLILQPTPLPLDLLALPRVPVAVGGYLALLDLLLHELEAAEGDLLVAAGHAFGRDRDVGEVTQVGMALLELLG